MVGITKKNKSFVRVTKEALSWNTLADEEIDRETTGTENSKPTPEAGWTGYTWKQLKKGHWKAVVGSLCTRRGVMHYIVTSNDSSLRL